MHIPLGMEASGKKRLQDVVCYKVGDEAESFDLEGGGTMNFFACLFCCSFYSVTFILWILNAFLLKLGTGTTV